MEAPKRRYQMELKLGADDLKALRSAINSILFDLDRYPEDTPYESVSGGYDSGYSIKINVDTTITHESWEKVLNEYLEEKHRSDSTVRVTVNTSDIAWPKDGETVIYYDDDKFKG